MSISSIFQIADRLLKRDFPQNSDQPDNRRTLRIGTANTNNAGGDRFTSSQLTGTANIAGEAGIFQLEKLRFTAVSIQATGTNDAAQAPATGQTATPLTARTAVTLPSANAAQAPVNASQAAPTVAAATGQTAKPLTLAPAVTPPANNAVPVATAAQTAPQDAVQSQAALQTLNSALAALGLDPAAIAAFDQFAGVLLQINPNALQDLETQLTSLAQQFSTVNGSAAAPATTNANGNAAANPATSAPTPGFQLTALSIKFTDFNETVQQSGQNGNPGTTTQISAYSLQVREVSVSLTAPNGQAVQLQSPQAAASAPVAPTAPAAKVATA